MKKTIALIALTIAFLVGCSSTQGNVSTDKPAGTNTPSSTPTTEPSSPATEEGLPETTEPSTPETTTLKFGQSFTWEDGLSVTVSAPKTYHPTDSASGDEDFKYAIKFTIVVVNKTGKSFDASMANINVQSNDQDGSSIFDFGNGVDGAPQTKLLNGRQAKYSVAFAVANPKDIVLELSPDYDHASAIWTN